MRALIVAAFVLAAPARLARADESIVVASDDPAFRSAVVEAVTPAGMVVISVNDPVPASIANISVDSRSLADREHATATVWLLFTLTSATLVTYDRTTDRVLVRTLPFVSPLSASQAAEAARVTRTMLRALRVPDEPQPSRPLQTQAIASPVAEDEKGAILGGALQLGTRLRGPGSTVKLDAAATLVWRPGDLGVAVTAAFGPSSAVQTAAFVGAVMDNALAVVARRPFDLGRGFALAPCGGLALHMINLKGDLTTAVSTDTTRYDPAIQVGAAVTYALRHSLGVGVVMSADWLLRRQTYEAANGEQVLAVPSIQGSLGVVITVRIL